MPEVSVSIGPHQNCPFSGYQHGLPVLENFPKVKNSLNRPTDLSYLYLKSKLMLS